MLNLEKDESLHKLFKRRHAVFAYLFGSQATGKTGRLSDIDIAVYFGPEIARQHFFDKKLGLLGELNDYFKTDALDLVVLNDAPNLLAHRILKQGKLIYCSDDKVRLDYEVRAVLNYLDWKPMLDNYAHQVLGVPRRGR